MLAKIMKAFKNWIDRPSLEEITERSKKEAIQKMLELEQTERMLEEQRKRHGLK